eukprot:6481848-Prymnesium_polylepis.1
MRMREKSFSLQDGPANARRCGYGREDADSIDARTGGVSVGLHSESVHHFPPKKNHQVDRLGVSTRRHAEPPMRLYGLGVRGLLLAHLSDV